MKNLIKKMIQNELEEANTKFLGFNSRHEAYAVMLEEFEEVTEEMEEVTYLILEKYWGYCRNSKITSSYEINLSLESLETHIVKCVS